MISESAIHNETIVVLEESTQNICLKVEILCCVNEIFLFFASNIIMATFYTIT